MGQIILASASPRRKELLEQIGLEFEICPAKGEEVISKSAPEEVPQSAHPKCWLLGIRVALVAGLNPTSHDTS